MVRITKEDARLIRAYFPGVHIRRTTHQYYMEEAKRAIAFLKRHNANRECGT